MTPAPTSEVCNECGRPHISALERLQIKSRIQVAVIAVESLVTKLSPSPSRSEVDIKSPDKDHQS